MIAHWLERAGIAPSLLKHGEPLSGGTYNTLYRLRLTDGRALILKLPPEPGTPALAYERGLLVGEATFYRAAAEAGVPVPALVHADPSFVLMTDCPGLSWAEAPPTEAERPGLRRELGELVARLHTVTGPGFGYPGGALPRHGSWRATFTAMLDAVLADALRFVAPLPMPPARIRELAERAAPALDEVRVPALVHFDLWDGNVLLHEGRVSALIDGERMFFGDPLAEFTSLNLLAGPEADPDLLKGYAAGGGRAVFDEAAHRRMALYRTYLYLIMLTEGAPRAYPAAQLDWARQATAGPLTAALELLAAP